MSTSASREGACSDLARRLCGDDPALSGVRFRDAAARRVFDALGALEVGRRVAASTALPSVGTAGSLTDPLSRVRELCAAIRSSEIDDIDALALVTPGAVVVPVALVLADELGADGPALLSAINAGYEAMISLGEGLDGAGLLARGVWPTYLLAPAAAAATAAALLGLDESYTCMALSIALARAAGVAGRPPAQPTSRWWLCGCAAADGVLAAQAAAAGLIGDPGLLERGLGPDGLIKFDGDRLRGGDPVRLELVETKPFSTARQALPAVRAAELIRDRIGDHRPTAVHIEVPEAFRSMVDRPAPGDRTSSLQSAQFQVAAALAGDPILYDPVRTMLTLGDAADNFMKVASVTAAPDLSDLYPGVWSARVTVRLDDGQELAQIVAEAPGQAPQPEWDQLLSKYLSAGWGTSQATQAFATCQALSSGPSACAGPVLSIIAI